MARSPVCMGRVPSLPPFQALMLRFDFACSRKTRPRVMFKQPTEKRKNAATRENLSTWWERTVAPMLKKQIRIRAQSRRALQQGGKRDYLQCLENPEWSEAELRAEDGEKAVEKGYRPRDLGEKEKDELEDNEKTVDHCPEGTCRLIGNCAASERYTNRISITIYQAKRREQANPM